jgi:NDP-sugar pyrophosphorylase family protein
MAHVIGIGTTEQNADRSMLACATHVEYENSHDFGNRVEAVSAENPENQFQPFQVIRYTSIDLIGGDLNEKTGRIQLNSRDSNTPILRTDRVCPVYPATPNYSCRFVTFPIQKNIDQFMDQLSGLEKLFGEEKVCIEFTPDMISLVREIMECIPVQLSLTIDGPGSLEEIGEDLLNRVVLLRVGDTGSDSIYDGLGKLFAQGKLEQLRAVTYTEKDPENISKISGFLRRGGATLLEDLFNAEYYFGNLGDFAYRDIFDGVRYVWDVLGRIPAYALDETKRYTSDIKRKLSQSIPETTETAEGSVIEKGARVEKGALIGYGVIIKSGTVVRRGARVEDNAVIGRDVYIAPEAVVKGGFIEDNVYIGKNVRIEGPCRIQHNVYIDDGPALIRNSVIENDVYFNRGVFCDGTTAGNRIVIDENCRILPGAYLRKDTIFGRGVVFRSESKNTIIMNAEKVIDPGSGKPREAGSEAGHYGYVGDSILGDMVNEGAGDKNSNVKNDWGQIRVNIDGWKIDTGISKFGAIIGDYTAVGCLTVLEPGTLIGKGCNIYGAKVRSWIQTGSVFAEEGVDPRERYADALPPEQESLDGRSAPVIKVLEDFRQSGDRRIE